MFTSDQREFQIIRKFEIFEKPRFKVRLLKNTLKIQVSSVLKYKLEV